jgi:hypothetical protein
MRPVAEIEARLRMSAGQAHEDFVRVQSHAGKRVADAVGRVQRDVEWIRQTRLLNTVLFHLPVESGAADAEQARRLAAPSLGRG